MAGLSVELDAGAVCLLIERGASGSTKPFGSGFFFMRDDIVVTAKHVLQDRPDPTAPFAVLQKRYDGAKEGILPIEVSHLEEVDISLIRVSKEHVNLSHPLYPSHFGLNNAKGFCSIGYDRNSGMVADNTWAIKIHHVGIFDIQEREHGRFCEFCIQFDSPWITPGYSGGPVIGEGGGVVGLITQMFSEVTVSGPAAPKSRARATSIYPAAEAFISPFEYQALADDRKRLLQVERSYLALKSGVE